MELYLPPIIPNRDAKTGRFVNGNTPHNKGRKMSEWMDADKMKRVIENAKKNLRSRYDIGGKNKKPIIMIDKEGKHYYFESSYAAERITGIKSRNIRNCCKGKQKTAGGYRWFWFNDDGWLTFVKE